MPRVKSCSSFCNYTIHICLFGMKQRQLQTVDEAACAAIGMEPTSFCPEVVSRYHAVGIVSQQQEREPHCKEEKEMEGVSSVHPKQEIFVFSSDGLQSG